MRWEILRVILGPIDSLGHCPVYVSSLVGEANGSFSVESLASFWDGAVLTEEDFDKISASSAAVRWTGDQRRELGELLFEALFSGACRDLFYMTEGFVSATRRALRLVVQVDLDIRGGRWLQCQPWELLYQRTTKEFFVLRTNRSIVRHLSVVQPPSARDQAREGQVLTVAAFPSGYTHLNLAAEVDGLLNLDQAHFKILKNPAIRDFQRELQKATTLRSFHFMGHGGFRDDHGVILFADSSGKAIEVDGEMLDACLKEADLDIVVLNSCRTAAPGKGSDPYAGLAVSLACHGFPAVVAMREPIKDPAAIVFSTAFHRQVLACVPFDEAMNRARRSLKQEYPDDFSWSKPVLFLRRRAPAEPEAYVEHVYRGLAKLPPFLQQIGSWAGLLSGLLGSAVVIEALAILLSMTPLEMPALLSGGLAVISALFGLFLGRSRFPYDVRSLIPVMIFLALLLVLTPFVPRKMDLPLDQIGNLSGWSCPTHPPTVWLAYAPTRDGCRTRLCHHFTYRRGGDWAGIYWFPWACANVAAGPQCSLDLEAKGARRIRRISFLARGQAGGEVLDFKVGSPTLPPSTQALSGVVLTDQWQRYEIPLEGMNLGQAVALFGWFASDAANPTDISFYLDDIRFEGIRCPLGCQ